MKGMSDHVTPTVVNVVLINESFILHAENIQTKIKILIWY